MDLSQWVQCLDRGLRHATLPDIDDAIAVLIQPFERRHLTAQPLIMYRRTVSQVSLVQQLLVSCAKYANRFESL